MFINVSKICRANADIQPFEIVEAKGKGHPDSICDQLVEQIASSLINIYMQETGEICHFNVDKALLRGGTSIPRFGGGEVVDPIEIYIAGRATCKIKRKNIPIDEIINDVCKSWLSENIHNLDIEKHIKIVSFVRPGSQDLSDIFSRDIDLFGSRLSNDTSFGVGYSPLSRLENLVNEVSRSLSSSDWLSDQPAFGEDTKVMGIRKHNEIELIVACALVDKYISSLSDYLEKKELLERSLKELASTISFLPCKIIVNAADQIEKESIYLTVTGTSAECGDDGQVGRGNRINGLITPYRPMSIEAASGKNPITHVGRIYNYWAREICQSLIDKFGLSSCECYLVGQIGAPINQPNLVDLRVSDLEEDSCSKKELVEFISDFLGEKIFDK